MNTLLQIGATNALCATALAVVAAVTALALRRPPLTRALWLLVLLKLLTPPIWSIPLWHSQANNQPQVGLGSSATVSDYAEENFIDAESPPVQEPPPTTIPPVARRKASPWRDLLSQWPRDLFILWLSGSCIYAAAIVAGTLRLHRIVKASMPVPLAIERRLQALVKAMDLHHPPQVRFISRSLPPMLCAVGQSARILLPVGLWQKLDERQQDSVLVHELAHLRRLDHWVRALELLVCVLYWWHPVVWWARRELREASEQCCDAWVVWTMPRLAKRYAAALIETIDYISSAPTGVPALAAGFGQFTNLRRRLVMIKQGNVMRSLTRPALATVFGTAGLVLPLSPALGQAALPSAPETPVVVAPVAPVPSGNTSAVEVAPTAPVAIEASPLPKTATQEEDDADPRGGSDRAELQKARAEIQALRAQLRAAERRLADMERANRRTEIRPPKAGQPFAPPAAQREFGLSYKALPPAPANRAMARSYSRADDEAFTRAGEKLRAAGQELNDARDRARQTVERRLDQMDRQLTNMVDQLRQMKRQLSDQSNDRPSPERK